jgi:hypothetical protein
MLWTGSWQNSHQLLERLEWFAQSEIEFHIAQADEIFMRAKIVSMLRLFHRTSSCSHTGNPGCVMVGIIPSPAAATFVIVIHDPLETFDVFVHDLLDVLFVLGFKFGL